MTYQQRNKEANGLAAQAERLAGIAHDAIPVESFEGGAVILALVALTNAVLAVERRLAAGQAQA